MTGSEITAFIAGVNCGDPAGVTPLDLPGAAGAGRSRWTTDELRAYDRLGHEVFMFWFERGMAEAGREW